MIELFKVTLIAGLDPTGATREEYINPLRVITVSPSRGDGAWIDVDSGGGSRMLQVKEAAAEIGERWAKAMRGFGVVTPPLPVADLK